MTYEPKWLLNNNGNSAADIRSDYMDLHKAAMDFTNALAQVKANSLHGRNYQTLAFSDECRDADLRYITDLIVMSQQTQEHAIAGAARLIKQREGL